MQYCNICSEHLDSKDNFCPRCGNPIVQAANANPQSSYNPPPGWNTGQHTVQHPTPVTPQYTDAYAPPPIPAPKPKQKKPVSKSGLAIFLSAIAVLLIGGVILTVYLVNQAGKASDYDEAMALMDSGKYSAAQAIFTDLGNYKDAEEFVIQCQNIISYNTAIQQMESGNYQVAKIAFEALGNFRDSREMVVECQKGIDYDLAMETMASGDFTGAKSMFESLIPYKDSALHANDCGNIIAYGEALELIDAGNYVDAIAKLEPLAEQGYKDSSDLIQNSYYEIDYRDAVTLMTSSRYDDAVILLEPLALIDFRDSIELRTECNNNITYAKADSAYRDELFYTAYTLFRSISGFSDSSHRADSCIQDIPATGQTYRNSDYSGTTVSLRIRTPRDDTRPTFLKIYTAEGVHVSSLFIRSGGSHTVKIPVGTYMIKMAYGETWFGSEEMFGDSNAYYQVLILDGNNTTYSFRRNYTYTLTLRNATNGNVGTRSESRDGF